MTTHQADPPKRLKERFMPRGEDRRCLWSRRKLFGSGCGAFGVAISLRHSRGLAGEEGKLQQPSNPSSAAFIKPAFAMRDLALSVGDQGYGAVIVDSANLRIVGQAPSRVVTNRDPTGHAEVEAIRDATRRLGTRDLSNHVMYSSSKPCPMCEAASYWSNLTAYYYGLSGTNGGAPRLCR
ncbi:MAG: nucleoside deaminase [Hyphomicrobiaceae bacterium]